MTIKEIEIQLALGTLTYEMKRELVSNKKTPKKILAILSTDKDWNIRRWVAYHPNTPVEVLTKLSTDENNRVRWWVVRNPNYTRTTDLEDSRP